MFGIFDKIEEFFKELLLGGIQANLESMFLDINNQVNSVAADVGKTPMGWNGEVFSFIKNISYGGRCRTWCMGSYQPDGRVR